MVTRRSVLSAGLFIVIGAVLGLWPGSLHAQAAHTADAGGEGLSVVYLVRHAERAEDHPTDTNLSDAGHARAQELARALQDAPVSRVFSTDYRRTRQTAAPVAAVHGVEVESYDPSGQGMATFAATLRGTPGHHLVVGHSNTTPYLVQALGGDPVSAIDEMEYDRLYVVMIAPDGAVTSTLIRFGEPFQEEAAGGH